jgi:WD40 repeat protein
LVARSDYRKILLADAISGKELLSLDFDLPCFLSISSDGELLLASSYENTTHVWDISALTRQVGSMPSETATPVPTLSPTPTVTPLPVKPLVVQPQPLPSPQPGAITAQNVDRVQPLGTIGLGHAETVVWSPDEQLLAIGGRPGIYIFATGASKPAHFLPTDGMVLTMAFSSDGKRLAGQIELSTAEVWDVPSGRSLYKLSLEGTSCLFKQLTFSPDGQTFLHPIVQG